MTNEELEKQTAIARDMDDGCAKKAKERGQQTFTLVAQDLSSPAVICEWIKQNIETAPDAKLVDALLDALAMRKYPNRKAAD